MLRWSKLCVTLNHASVTLNHSCVRLNHASVTLNHACINYSVFISPIYMHAERNI